LDLGVDFFLRIDRLNPDQHPTWTSGSGLIVGEGMIMAEVGEGFSLTPAISTIMIAAEFSAFTEIIPRCVARAHKHDTSPDPGPGYPAANSNKLAQRQKPNSSWRQKGQDGNPPMIGTHVRE